MCTWNSGITDDKEQYPSTVGVTCKAPQKRMILCFTYDQYRAMSEGERKPEVNVTEMKKSLEALRRIGKR